MKKVLFALTFALINLNSFAQVDPKVDQSNAWVFYTGNHKITEKWGLHTEYQFRRNEGLSKPMQNQIRLGVDYTFNSKVMLTVGWSYVESYAYGDLQDIDLGSNRYNQFKFNEQRIWEQLNLKHEHVGRFHLDSRFRLEQRWSANVKDVNSNPNIDDFQRYYNDTDGGFWKYRNRARYRFRVQVPLTSSEMKDNTLFFVAADEIFANFGKHVSANIFDQNRLYLALGWRFTKSTNVQLGYMNQFIEKGNGVAKENNHTLQVAITHNIDFSKLFKSKKTE